MGTRRALAAVFGCLLATTSSFPPPAARAGVLDARLRTAQAQVLGTSLKADTEILVTVRFVDAPDTALLTAVTAAGARFFGHDAQALPRGKSFSRESILGGRTVFPVRIRLAELDRLAAVQGVRRIEATTAPGRQPLLFQTRAIMGAEDAWQLTDDADMPLRGTGVVIADFDTGVDLFHPDYWNADGNVVSWIDVDLSGDYGSGDAVDANGNLLPDPGETLAWLNAPGSAPGLDGTLQLPIDHFYQDLNDNAARDFGPEAGFSESDPTYGEPVFRVLDDNENGLLDVGEQLVALGTCKARAVLQTDGTVKTLGVDLIQNEGDLFGHGTNVGSIIAGSEIDRRFGGIAPEAILLFGNLDFAAEEDPVFEDQLVLGMSWSAAQGADIMMYEFGGWVWEFLDGSSNIEQLINEYAEDGIIQLTASGNLTTGSMHWEGDLGAAQADLVETVLNSDSGGDPITDIFGDFYWIPDGGSVEVMIEAPSGETAVLSGNATTAQLGNYEVFHVEDTSPRGTYRLDFQISVGDPPTVANLHGTWRFVLRRTVAAKTAVPLRVHGMVVDNISGWFGNSVWETPVSINTVTWPATADSSITVAAFNPTTGGFNNFSGRGRRIDGARIIDIAAPGSATYTAARNEVLGGVPGGYSVFGGTSAALPHVAGAAALIKQWDPTITNGEMRTILRGGAVADANTGNVPNEWWGDGKLNVFQSILIDAPTAAPAGRALGANFPTVAPNVPNPFNPATTIRYSLPAEGEVQVQLLDIRGRRVATLAQGQQPAGDHEIVWRGVDDGGRPVGSGIYLVRVQLDGREAARKVTLLR